jgi:hypothetical protein
MKYLLRSIAWLTLLVAGSSFAATPNSIQASYEIYKGGMKVGRIDEAFTVGKDNHYTLVSTTRATGLLALFKPGKIILRSSGLIGNHGLKPLHFSDFREDDEDKNSNAEFDWNTRKLTLIQQKLRTVLPLPDDTQDRISAMYQFLFLSLSKTDTLDFHMTNGSKLDIYNYRITHDQTVTVPLGTFKALYIASVPEKGSNRTEIWLAEKHANFPCKIVITDPDGGSLSQVLTKFTSTP